jgi:hypothetical protein
MELIAKAKLQGLALQYLKGKEDLLKDSCPYAVIKKSFIERFSDKVPDQYHYTQLQDAVQVKVSPPKSSGTDVENCVKRR